MLSLHCVYVKRRCPASEEVMGSFTGDTKNLERVLSPPQVLSAELEENSVFSADTVGLRNYAETAKAFHYHLIKVDVNVEEKSPTEPNSNDFLTYTACSRC